MKQQHKLTLLAASLVTAFAANVSYAGNIQSSSVAIARETITSDTQSVRAPLITYQFQGAINATLQAQTLQVQLVLTGGGQWATGVAASIDLYGSAISGGNGAIIPAAILPGTGAGGATPSIGTTTTTNDTLYVTFTVPQGIDNNFPTPALRFNPTVVASSTLSNLFTAPVKTVAACDTLAYSLPVAIKHFTGVTAAGIANGTTNGVADEHVRNGQNSTGTLLTFPTNIKVTVTKSGQVAGKTGTAKVNPAAQSRFIAPVGANSVTVNVSLANLGSISLATQAAGYDSGIIDVYGFDATTIGIATAVKNGTVGATPSDGFIEATNLTVTTTATSGFATGSSTYLSVTPQCTAAIAGSTTASTTALTIVNTLTTANLASLYSSPVYVADATYPGFAASTVHVCYDVTAVTTAIPQATFNSVAVLTKAAGTLPFPEQNNSCSGDLFPLSGGIKIDVRNWATDKTTGGWLSVIRLINPSETATATVFGQLLHSNGNYGGWGQIATLAPRAVKNMTSAEVAALITTAPAAAAGIVGTTETVAASVGDRLRITADGVGSLRVQNYMYNPDSKNFIEASSSQGVDFDGNTDRAPANEGQYQDQDAQSGLRK